MRLITKFKSQISLITRFIETESALTSACLYLKDDIEKIVRETCSLEVPSETESSSGEQDDEV